MFANLLRADGFSAANVTASLKKLWIKWLWHWNRKHQISVEPLRHETECTTTPEFSLSKGGLEIKMEYLYPKMRKRSENYFLRLFVKTDLKTEEFRRLIHSLYDNVLWKADFYKPKAAKQTLTDDISKHFTWSAMSVTKLIVRGRFHSPFLSLAAEWASRHEAIGLTHLQCWRWISRVNATCNCHGNQANQFAG